MYLVICFAERYEIFLCTLQNVCLQVTWKFPCTLPHVPLQEGLNGVNLKPLNGQKINRQPSKMEHFYRQPSTERVKISCQMSFLF